MKRRLAAALLAGLSAAPAATAAEPVLKNAAVEFPQNAETFPGGDKAAAINNNCLTCHSREMVLTQPALPREEWAKEVAKMQKVYGAQVSSEDVPAIVDYLASLHPGK